jgi:rubrerythrin
MPTTETDGPALRELRDDPGSRRSFLRMSGAGAAGALGMLLAACGDDGSGAAAPAAMASTGAAAQTAGGDVEIVNYALTLEYIEADFYRQVIASGAIRDRKIAELAKSIGEHEQAHVEALRGTVRSLGGRPAAKPRTNFDSVLEGGATRILRTAATVENVGAAAYLGQAGRIKSKEILAAALSIHSVEARHAAALNELVGRGYRGMDQLEGSLPSGAFAAPLSMAQVLKRVKPFLAS